MEPETIVELEPIVEPGIVVEPENIVAAETIMEHETIDQIDFDVHSTEEDGVNVEHMSEDGDSEEDELVEGSVGGYINPTDPILEPYEGMEFESEEAARIFYNSYARRVGFSIRARSNHSSRKDGSIICRKFVCSRQGFYHKRDRGSKNKQKKPRTTTKVGCTAVIVVNKQSSGKWVVTRLLKDHNHELVPPDQIHRLWSHRHVSGPDRSLIDTLQAAGIGPSKVMSALAKESGGVENVGFTSVDFRNYIASRQRAVDSGGKQVLDSLKRLKSENPTFFYAVQGESEHSVANIFWADASCKTQYKYFGDTVIFDTIYRTNRYRVPFATFTGLNHHGLPVLFGCALLLNESEASFIWLFETWLSVMSGRHPISITTDQDRVIQSAVEHVFPDTRLRFCKLNIFREAQDKLSTVYQLHPTFEAEFLKCINTTETIEEFESTWKSLLEKYNILDYEWLHSMYIVRHQWVPVFTRDIFFGEMPITQGSDTLNSFFDGFVNPSTTFQVLIKQYEKALVSRHEKEVWADYDTIKTAPLLKTPSPMEKQAAALYTKRIFIKFQEELVGTLAITATKTEDTGTVAIYKVAKFGEDFKAFIVRFHVFEMKADCSCKMFEFSGIVCRHILAVFRVTNVLTLPSHYIVKRWTRNAKSGIVMGEGDVELHSKSRESATDLFNNLREEAIKYVDEGTKSVHVYKVAMDALKEASKKVAAAKRHGSIVPQTAVLVNGSNQETHVSEGNRLDLLELPSTMDQERSGSQDHCGMDDTSDNDDIHEEVGEGAIENYLGKAVDDGEVPKVGMLFDNVDVAYDYYNDYATRVGFSVRVKRRNKNRRNPEIFDSQTLVCKCQGYYHRVGIPQRKRESRRFGCMAEFHVIRVNDKYKLSRFTAEHTHPLVHPDLAVTTRYSELSLISRRVLAKGAKSAEKFLFTKEMMLSLESKLDSFSSTNNKQGNTSLAALIDEDLDGGEQLQDPKGKSCSEQPED